MLSFTKIKLIESNNKFHLHLVQTNQYLLRFEFKGYTEEKSLKDYIFFKGKNRIKLYVEENEGAANFKFALLADIEAETLEGIIDVFETMDITDVEKIKFKIPTEENLKKYTLLVKMFRKQFHDLSQK